MTTDSVERLREVWQRYSERGGQDEYDAVCKAIDAVAAEIAGLHVELAGRDLMDAEAAVNPYVTEVDA